MDTVLFNKSGLCCRRDSFYLRFERIGSPATARRGNLLSSVGMLIAVVVTLFDKNILDYKWILLGVVIGSIIGAIAARIVAMTAMPEMVALFNGSGGLSSLLVGFAAIFLEANTTFSLITIILSILIGGVTFTGSLIA